MNPLDSFRQMLGTTGAIALVLSIVFGLAALVNLWKRKRQNPVPAPKAGPILMNDPHTGTPVSGPATPRPTPAPPVAPLLPPALNPEPRPTLAKEEKHAAPEARPTPLKNAQIFRQLDARGVDVATGRSGKNDEYQWE